MKQHQIKNKQIVVMFAVSVIAIAALYIQTGFAEPSSSNVIQANPTTRMFLDVDWNGFPYLENMTDYSSDIVVGKVTSIKDSTGIQIPITSFEITVEKSLKGNLTNGDKITELQIGGIRPEQATVDNDVLMKVGEEYVMYLKYYSKTNTYDLVGGPQGRLLVTNSMVYSMDNVDVRTNWIPLKEKDKPISDYESEISTKISRGVKN